MFDDSVKAAEAAYDALKSSAETVFGHMRNENYKGKYCYPFYSQGSYYVEPKDECVGKYCFLPDIIDGDMRKFVDDLRKMDQSVRPLFGWNIRSGKDWGDQGNVVVGDVNGWCYFHHEGHRFYNLKEPYAVLVGVVCFGVYKDAFFEEILEIVKETGRPITKSEFRIIEAFTR